jgi:hypothetical protein
METRYPIMKHITTPMFEKRRSLLGTHDCLIHASRRAAG